MRKLTAATFLSLDGVMQAPGGPDEDTEGGFALGGWTFHYFDEAMGSVMAEAFKNPFELVLGRKTYEIFAAYWPKASADDAIGSVFNATVKHVGTHRPDGLDWENSRSLGPDVVAGLREVMATDGPDLLLQGSGDLIQTLLAADIIDEFRLMIFPLVLGKGKRLFGQATMPAAFKLLSSKTSSTGVIIATYARDGEIKTGSFA